MPTYYKNKIMYELVLLFIVRKSIIGESVSGAALN